MLSRKRFFENLEIFCWKYFHLLGRLYLPNYLKLFKKIFHCNKKKFSGTIYFENISKMLICEYCRRFLKIDRVIVQLF